MSEINKSPPRKLHKRFLRNFWLNPAYQKKYIFWVSLTGLALMFINSTIFYVFTRENYIILVDLSPMDSATKQQLYAELRQIIGWLMLGNGAFLGVIALIGLIYSHRTVGPLYHFKRVFDEIKGGNMTARVRLRPKDDFQDVAVAFNEMMDALNKK